MKFVKPLTDSHHDHVRYLPIDPQLRNVSQNLSSSSAAVVVGALKVKGLFQLLQWFIRHVLMMNEMTPL